MKAFLHAFKLLFDDLASSLLFILLFSTTHNAVLSILLGMSLGLIQIALHLARKKPVDIMAWLSLFLVAASGTATLLTHDPRFVMFKPSAIYAIVGIVMLKPGWMIRYLPAIAKAVAADIATYVGFAWAGLMFISAIVNACLAANADLATWALTMTLVGIAGKVIMFVCGFAAIRLTARRRIRAMPADQRDVLLISTGWHASPPSQARPA